MNLEQMTNKVCAIINGNVNTEKLDLFSNIGLQYYCIRHDKDTDKDGVLKTIHYHLILVRSTRSRVKWYLTRICDILELKENQVSVMPCDSLVASVQYLVHLNDTNKYQYSMYDIDSNVDFNKINTYMSKDLTQLELDFETLQDICISCSFRIVDIMKVIGIGRYNAFRSTIKDFINEFRPIYERELMKNDLIDKGIK